MSLINDALKRAKQAQGQTPTVPGPQLRPVELVATASHPSRLAVRGISVAVIGLALFLAWRLVRTNGSIQPGVTVPQVPAVANAVPAPKPAPITQHAPAQNVEATATVPPRPSPAATLGTSVEAHSSSASNPVASAPVAAAATDVAVTISPTNAPVVPEKAAPPKLQGIMYQPGHPAAMISGKMVFIGDKFGQWRVAAIDQESATLIGAGQTNILTLPQ